MIDTPGAVAALDAAFRNDLGKVGALFVEGASLLEMLEESVRVLPSSQSRIRAWRNQLAEIVKQIGEEQADASRKLSGTDAPTIESAVNEAHADRVIALKREA